MYPETKKCEDNWVIWEMMRRNLVNRRRHQKRRRGGLHDEDPGASKTVSLSTLSLLTLSQADSDEGSPNDGALDEEEGSNHGGETSDEE